MGFNLNKAKAAKESILNSFIPLELNEGNVQAIFNRCLANPDSKEITYAALFPTTHGYNVEDETNVQFDKAALLSNKQIIMYLFGQLQQVHLQHQKGRVNIDDYNTNYRGEHWTRDKATVLKLCYLGVSPVICCITPFRKAALDTSLIMRDLKPTLSPKDPNFPAWWEAHKGEWE